MKITLGIVAHVDAGKTTLSEAMLYTAGTIRHLGRVDNRDTYLDSEEQERKRGITVVAKQASFSIGEKEITLIDTPGHMDFSSEAEAVLPVLDCAILLISRADGITAYTETLWRLLAQHAIPTFVFVNKFDLPGKTKEELLRELQGAFGQGFVDADEQIDAEEAAMCAEELMEEYLRCGSLSDERISEAIAARMLFPCFFGSALRLQGVSRLLDALERWAPGMPGGEECTMLGAKVFQIFHDDRGNRITRMKITSGTLRAKSTITVYSKNGKAVTEKVDRILIRQGKTERICDCAGIGSVVSVTGLNSTYVGQGIGCEEDAAEAQLRPTMSYRMVLPKGCSAYEWMPRLKKLEEENPLLQISWVARTEEIRVSLTGEVQIEVLTEEIGRRFGISVSFDEGSVLYQETITKTVEGVGHFEPLRHYAEVHLLLEPLPRGEGVQIVSACPPDRLAVNWQRNVLESLRAQTLIGTLTGSPLTDLRITLISGKAHPKHSESNDFAQAAQRALRQGLMRACPILLEPHYDFRMMLPEDALGRAMTDLALLGGSQDAPNEENGWFLLRGHAPVSAMRRYVSEIPVYTHGKGRVTLRVGSYYSCPAQDEIVQAIGYRPESDPDHPADSIFCKNGAGFSVPWQSAESYMHVPTRRSESRRAENSELGGGGCAKRKASEFQAEDRELMAIFERTYGPIKQRRLTEPRRIVWKKEAEPVKAASDAVEYLLVDAYNVIFCWEDLRNAAESSLDLARNMLLHLMMNYRGYRGCRLILVFDAYRISGGSGSIEEQGGVYVVYTREAETADSFIERVSYLLGEGSRRETSRSRVRVVTSDGKEQLIVLGNGAVRVSAEQFYEEVCQTDDDIARILNKLKQAK